MRQESPRRHQNKFQKRDVRHGQRHLGNPQLLMHTPQLQFQSQHFIDPNYAQALAQFNREYAARATAVKPNPLDIPLTLPVCFPQQVLHQIPLQLPVPSQFTHQQPYQQQQQSYQQRAAHINPHFSPLPQSDLVNQEAVRRLLASLQK